MRAPMLGRMGSPMPGRMRSADAALDADACVPIEAGATALYVDVNAGPNGTGAAGCPLRPITSALALASAPATIYVAAGT